MKTFRLFIAATTLAALCCMASCEKQKLDDAEQDDDYQNSWTVNGIENDFLSTVLTMVGDNLAIAASPEEGLTDVTSIMESDEFFYAAVSSVLLNKEFNPKNETSAFTIISSLNEALLEAVAPDKTDEIRGRQMFNDF